MINCAMTLRTTPRWLYVTLIIIGAAGVGYWLVEVWQFFMR